MPQTWCVIKSIHMYLPHAHPKRHSFVLIPHHHQNVINAPNIRAIILIIRKEVVQCVRLNKISNESSSLGRKSRLLDPPNAYFNDSGGVPACSSDNVVCDSLIKSHWQGGFIPMGERSRSSYAAPQRAFVFWS
jgi:hypothetical protein